MIDTVVVHHVIVIQIATIDHKIDIALTLETDTDMTELLLLHNLTNHYMTTINAIHVPNVHHTDLRIDHHIDKIHAIDINHVPTLEIDKFPQYTSSYRPPSQPRQSRPFRSRSNSETRNKINNIQTEQSNSPINFEIHMYYPTERAKALTPTSWFYSLYLHTPERHNDKDHPSRLEISLLLDSGASILVLNYPTHLTMAKRLIITCNDKTNHTSKTSTVANQTEVHLLHYITATLNTAIKHTSRQFCIPFAVADIKYNILGTPFFEEYIQNVIIQDFTLQFTHQSKDQPNTTKFFSLLSKDSSYFSFIYRINSKTQIRSNPNYSKIAQFPLQNYYNVLICYNSQEPVLSHDTPYLFLL